MQIIPREHVRIRMVFSFLFFFSIAPAVPLPSRRRCSYFVRRQLAGRYENFM